MTVRNYQGTTPIFDSSVYIDPTALVVGDVCIGSDSSIWPMAVVRGDVNVIRIGQRTNIQDSSVLHVNHVGPHTGAGSSVEIGNDVTIGHRVTLHGCRIDDCCLIGIGSIVLDDVHIQKQVVLGAGSLVPSGKILESGYLYFGQPIKKIRALTPKEIEHLAYSATHYVKIKNNYCVDSTK